MHCLPAFVRVGVRVGVRLVFKKKDLKATHTQSSNSYNGACICAIMMQYLARKGISEHNVKGVYV